MVASGPTLTPGRPLGLPAAKSRGDRADGVPAAADPSVWMMGQADEPRGHGARCSGWSLARRTRRLRHRAMVPGMIGLGPRTRGRAGGPVAPLDTGAARAARLRSVTLSVQRNVGRCGETATPALLNDDGCRYVREGRDGGNLL